MEINGKRNLTVLGAIAILVAGITTGLSLFIYRSSGDIYLDRSRPGYLPDEKEVESNPTDANNNFTFSETGELTEKELNEYQKELKSLNGRIKALSDPYAPGPLSNESLGIPNEETDPKAKDSTTKE